MPRATRSSRQPSRSPDPLDDLINLRRYPVDPVDYENLFQQHQALLAAVDAVPTPASPDDGLLRYQPVHPMFQGIGPIFPDVPEDLFALHPEARATPERASGRRASRRFRSATPARSRVTVGSTPMLPAQSPRLGDLVNRGFFDLPANFSDSSPPRARAVSAVAGDQPSPGYTPTSPAYNPVSPEYNPYSAWAVSSPRSPVGGAVARRLDGIDATLERLQRRVDLRADRIDAQLLAITHTLANQREGAAASNNDRKRKRSSDDRDVIDLTGKTPSPNKVEFVDLVTDSSWSGSEFSSSGSSTSSSSSDSSDNEDNDDDSSSTPSKKPKLSPARSPRTPPNNHTPSPPRTPRKAPPRRPAPRIPSRQRAPSVPVTPPALRKTRAAASRSPAARAPRTPHQQTAPAVSTPPAAPRKNRSRSREATTSPKPAAAPVPAAAPAPAPARQPTRASSRIRERAAGTAYRPLLEKSITGRGARSCPRPGHK